MTTAQSVATLSLQLQHSSWSRERRGGESGEVRLRVFPPRTAVRCSVSMATRLTQSPHGGAGLQRETGSGILLACVCLTANVWWVFWRKGRGEAEREVEGWCVKVFSMCVSMVTLLWYYGRVTLSSLLTWIPSHPHILTPPFSPISFPFCSSPFISPCVSSPLLSFLLCPVRLLLFHWVSSCPFISSLLLSLSLSSLFPFFSFIQFHLLLSPLLFSRLISSDFCPTFCSFPSFSPNVLVSIPYASSPLVSFLFLFFRTQFSFLFLYFYFIRFPCLFVSPFLLSPLLSSSLLSSVFCVYLPPYSFN